MKELDELDELGLRRTLREVSSPKPPFLTLEGRKLVNFSSNDYLGLSNHPNLCEAAVEAAQTFGTGSTASRLVSGSLEIHHRLETEIAAAKKSEAALSFSSGYAAAVGIIPALVGKGDTVILDKLAHASLIDGARLSGAKLRIFPHNHLEKLEKVLKYVEGRTLIVTESVFSMDGDLCPLKEIVQLKNQYDALLLLDEAHATGVLGLSGLGLAEELGLQEEIEFQMGTLGKALGSAGGYLAASQDWIDLIVNKARSFIYSTAPPPMQAAASLAAFRLVQGPAGRNLREKLLANCRLLESQTPIVPRIIGDNEETLRISRELQEAGFLVPAIRFPTVPRGTARLRISLSAAHDTEQILKLREVLSQ